MIEKAYIEKIIDLYTYKVRIPRFDKSSSNNNKVATDKLATAEACTLPGCLLFYSVGDAVWVALYHQLYSLPVIIGKIYSKTCMDKTSKLYLDSNVSSTTIIEEQAQKIKKLESAVVLLLLLALLSISNVELNIYTGEEEPAIEIPEAEPGDKYLDFTWNNGKHKYILTKNFN